MTGVEKYDLAVVLGSGWNAATAVGEHLGNVCYDDWPCFPAGQVAGHDGRLIAVRHSSWNILIFSGRFHCYQGLSAYEAAFPVRLAAAFGCTRILLTCATGGINRKLVPGDFMLVEDHLNFLGDNPLQGLSKDVFVDMTHAYDLELYNLVEKSLSKVKTLNRGVLAAMAGPSYETPAEIRFLDMAGADVVSMSMVPEALMARYLNMKVAGVALVANFAAGIEKGTLNHQDVLNCSHKNSSFFPVLVQHIITGWQALNSRKPD